MSERASCGPTVREAAVGVAEGAQAVVRAIRHSPLISASTVVNHIWLSEGSGLDRSAEFLAAYPSADLAFGILSALRGICALLVSQNLIDAQALHEDLTRRIDHLKTSGLAAQALPIEDLRDAIEAMAREKDDADRAVMLARHAARSEGVQ
jgi:hypothetical protein